jgi:hypothetical protein
MSQPVHLTARPGHNVTIRNVCIIGVAPSASSRASRSPLQPWARSTAVSGLQSVTRGAHSRRRHSGLGVQARTVGPRGFDKPRERGVRGWRNEAKTGASAYSVHSLYAVAWIAAGRCEPCTCPCPALCSKRDAGASHRWMRWRRRRWRRRRWRRSARARCARPAGRWTPPRN